MKLLFVTPSDRMGGGNRVMFELAARLSRRHRVTCAFPRSPGRPKCIAAAGIRTVAAGFVSKPSLSVLLNLLPLYCWISDNKSAFDAIVSTGQTTGMLLPYVRHPRLFNFIQSDEYALLKQGHLAGRPAMFAVYSVLMSRSLGAPGIRYLFNSKFSLGRFAARHPGQGAPGILVHPGVDASVFHPLPARAEQRTLEISSLARPHQLKGLSTLLEAYRSLAPGEQAIARWRLASNDRLDGFGIPRSFGMVRPGGDTELAGFLGGTDIFVSSSLWEGFGLPALEAMACGCAVITSRNGGCDEYAVDGWNCLTYPPSDHRLLADCILRLAGDRKLRKRLSGNGIATARRFSWEAAARTLEGALSEG